jgi:flagellar basal body-associated protein FliL
MKSNILVAIGLLILLSVIATAIGIWNMSQNSEFSRKDQAPSAAPAAAQP